MNDYGETAPRPLMLVVTRMGANAAGVALAAGLFAGIVYGTGILPAARDLGRPTPAPAASAAARPAEATAPAFVPPVPVATAVPTAALTPAPTVAPTVAPTPAPIPLAPAVTAAAYTNGGRSYLALNVRTGTQLSAPFAGRVQILLYQYIAGDIRLGTNDPSRPYFPYLTLVGTDRRMIYRLPAQTTDSVVLVEDGRAVEAGDALFRSVGTGPTSWATFYDAGMTSSVLVSLAAIPSGRELDAAPLFAPR